MQRAAPFSLADLPIGLRRLGEGALARDGHDGIEPRPDALQAIEEVCGQLGRAGLLLSEQAGQLDD